MGLFDEIKGEIEAFSCFRKPNWLRRENGSPSWRENEVVGSPVSSKSNGTRQHEFKSIWEQSLDPYGTNKNRGYKSKPETWSIDWKKWPPSVPKFPKGVKIPVAIVPQIDLRLSLSGNWDEVTHGTTVAPVNFESKKFFENLGGHLNIAQSVTFKVTPTSLLFLHTKAGQFYSVKLKLYNSGNSPRRVRILPPANPSFDVIRQTDSKYPISPGRSLIVVVNYRPKTNDAVNDSLVFIVDRDGALVVPLISSSMPEPILEVEEWNCGCCVVGIPRTAHFEIKNVGGEGRFWILSEQEFNNEYLECYLKFKKNLIKDSTKELVKLHKEAMDGKTNERRTLQGRGEASGLIKRTRDSLDSEENDIFGNKPSDGKIQPRIYTRCFRIKPSCFRLQRNQRISIKVRYLPVDANFHYEKLCIMCENGEVRWIAVKGLGIERDSDKLIDIKAPWTGPPVDLPSDPRTKFVLDCGDLIAGEVAKLSFSIVNKSCIPLYFFWCTRPVLTDPEASPEKAETNIMDRFYEATIFDVEGGNLVYTGEEDTQNEHLQVWKSKFPLTISPAQGMLEKKQEHQITFTAECPNSFGYHACVISLFVEQVDEESKNAVLETLGKLNKDQLNRPISHVNLSGELHNGEDGRKERDERVVTIKSPNTPPRDGDTGFTGKPRTEEAAPDTDVDDDYVPMKNTIKEVKQTLDKDDQPPKLTKGYDPTNTKEEMVLPLVVAKRSSQQLLDQNKTNTLVDQGKKNQVSAEANQNGLDVGHSVNEMGDEMDLVEKKDSINIHYLAEASSVEEYNREMYKGHAVYEDLKNYTDNIVPQYQMWPNRDQVLTPVAEVEIWLHSVPLNVTFSPPFIVVNGLVKTCRERLIKVHNGTAHNIKMNFTNVCDDQIAAITCHPTQFSIKPFETFTFKVAIYFEKFGEMQRKLPGTIKLPFSTTPCFLSVYLKAYGPFLQVHPSTINFGIVPLSSETMKTLALKNGGDRPLKWVARIAPEGMEDENKREISGHQTRIHDKKLIRIWPELGVIEPGECGGMQVYFCAELHGEIASYIEVMVEGNPQSIVSVPVYGEIELPSLVLKKGLIQFYAEDFMQQPVQTGTCTIVNPSGFNVPFAWQCPVGRQSKLCSVYIHPKQGIIPAKAKMDFNVNVETFVRDDPFELDNLFVPCCVEGMTEPLILKITAEK